MPRKRKYETIEALRAVMARRQKIWREKQQALKEKKPEPKPLEVDIE